MRSIEGRRQAAMGKLMAIGTARRGQLSEQFYERTDSNGKVRRTGPYYVWQRWVKGKKRSVRVPASTVEQVRADLERGKKVQEIFDELWALMEQTAITEDARSKKKPRRPRQQSAGK